MPIMQLFSKIKKYLLKKEEIFIEKGRNWFYFGKHNLNRQYVSDFVLVCETVLS